MPPNDGQPVFPRTQYYGGPQDGELSYITGVHVRITNGCWSGYYEAEARDGRYALYWHQQTSSTGVPRTTEEGR